MDVYTNSIMSLSSTEAKVEQFKAMWDILR